MNMLAIIYGFDLIFQKAKVTFNKMVHQKRNNVLEWFIVLKYREYILIEYMLNYRADWLKFFNSQSEASF